MTDSIEMRSWIEQELIFDEVLAVGGGSADSSAFGKFVAPLFGRGCNEEIWQCIADAILHLRIEGMPVDELVWTFEDAKLWCVGRDDGAWLGVFTSTALPKDSAEILARRFAEFREAAGVSLGLSPVLAN